MKKYVILSSFLIAATQASAEVSFKDIENQAVNALNSLQAQSFRDKREYCGWVLDDGNALSVSKIATGTIDSCDLPETPAGYAAVASFHTHGNHNPDYYSEVPSSDDVEGDFMEETFGFVGTPGGRVWLIDPYQEEIFLLCGEGCIAVDAQYDAADYPSIPDGFTQQSLEQYLME